ncbi:transposase [Iodobacter ciconiae]|uniref:Transposase n=1 Tax=Iodobacter ciconiae TaxID=2496266 RepID=A0A3S8ZRI3_9NEIS|nr:transposase [Iodobacter ciconiae]AZN36099.1 hypothetical protein EJO50_06170 [Iodobacter ciconiae]
MAKQHPYELILEIIKQAEAGATSSKLSREYGINSSLISKWRVKYKGMDLAMMVERKRLILENIANKIRQAKQSVVAVQAEIKKKKSEPLLQPCSPYFSATPQAVQEAVQSWKNLQTSKAPSAQLLESRLQIVHDIAKAWDGECLSREYKSKVAYMSFRCGKGHAFESNARRLLYGNFCTVCYRAKPEGLKKLQDVAAARGWQSLATEYKDCKTPVSWRCDQGHEVKAPLESIKNGMGCMQCHKNRRWYTLEKMQAMAKLRGGLCLSDKYTTYEPMLWQCKRGHVWKSIPSNITRGSWCRVCGNIDKITRPNSKAWRKYPNGA